MNSSNSSFSSAPADKTSPSIIPDANSSVSSHFVMADTKHYYEGDRPTLSDEAREIAIKRAGLAVERHMAEYERTGCFAARGDAERAMRLMSLLIAGRSAEVVKKMEQERGL